MERIINRYKKYALVNCLLVLSLSLLVIPGWAFNITIFKSLTYHSVAMNPVTSIGFITAVLSLLFLTNEKVKNQTLGKFFALLVFYIGLQRIGEVIFNLPFSISNIFFPSMLLVEPGQPNVIAPNTAASFLILGTALLLYRYKISRKNLLADCFAFTVTVISFSSILGYLYHSIELYKITSYIPMALPTAICFFLISLSILQHRSQFGFFSLFTRKYIGSKIARFLMPFAIIVPVLAGALRLYIGKMGLFSSNTGAVIFDTASVIFFIILIWRSCIFLNKENKAFNQEMKKRILAEEEARLNEEFLNALIENLPEMVFVKNEDLRFIRVNKATEATVGIKREELLGKTDYDFFPAAQADHFTQKDREVFSKKTMVVIPQEEISNKGNTRWLHTKKIIVEGANGQRFLLGISQDITERKKMDEQLREFNRELEQKVIERTRELRKKESEKQRLEKSLMEEKISHQKKLMQATIDGQEKEKKQIGMELHDNINQVLASIKLYIEIAKSDEHMKNDMLDKSKDQINFVINEIRNLSKALVPHGIETGGIAEGIAEIIETIQLSAGIHFSTCISATALDKLNNKQQIALYRIIQEQLNNILKHADAKNVFISFREQDDVLELCIEDDGKGFDAGSKRAGIGLFNIKSRIELLNGEMKINSAKGKGCKLEIKFFTQPFVAA